MSGFFQGYAQMMSSVGWRRDNVWSQGNGKNNPWGRSFKVKWLRLNTLPFQKTLHLKNPLNDYKPVKISRDCQVSIYCILVFPFYSYPYKLKCSSILCCVCVFFLGITPRYWGSSLWPSWWKGWCGRHSDKVSSSYTLNDLVLHQMYFLSPLVYCDLMPIQFPQGWSSCKEALYRAFMLSGRWRIS